MDVKHAVSHNWALIRTRLTRDRITRTRIDARRSHRSSGARRRTRLLAGNLLVVTVGAVLLVQVTLWGASAGTHRTSRAAPQRGDFALRQARITLAVRRLLRQELQAEETGNVKQALAILTPNSPMRPYEAETVANLPAGKMPSSRASLTIGPVAVVSVTRGRAVAQVPEVLGSYQVGPSVGAPTRFVHRHLVLVSVLQLHDINGTWRLFRRSYIYAKGSHLMCKGAEQCALAITGT